MNNQVKSMNNQSLWTSCAQAQVGWTVELNVYKSIKIKKKKKKRKKEKIKKKEILCTSKYSGLIQIEEMNNTIFYLCCLWLYKFIFCIFFFTLISGKIEEKNSIREKKKFN